MHATMPTLHYSEHPQAVVGGSEFTRHAVRAIITHQDQILLLYTARYDDYSLPGGGVDEGESLAAAVVREVEEETGARNVTIKAELGRYEELRPWYKASHDNVRMHSYCYWCSADPTLGQTRLEDYEQANGMKPLWMNLADAIAHNEQIIASSDKAGLSVQRELWLLRHIAAKLKNSAAA
ncbi:NUDIX domain-containing protein [uncultured Ferrimonas sp.]|uniref:NUDIX hydrolase n=1 Tax=uncultured Ferrimonas sp. TaxID=432640 RepID=UPI002619001C|nr:NUDIX domain-containing protein [uncultured Ferrimonas sp.]